MTNKKMLNDYIDRSGLKRGYVAEKIGMTRQGFNHCLNSKIGFRASHILILCDLLGIDAKHRDAIFFENFGD